MPPLRSALLSIGLGLVGMLVALVVWHLWVDHQTWHVLLNNLSQAGSQAAPPSGP